MQHKKTIIIRKPYENDAISESKLEHDDLLAQNDTLYETKKYMKNGYGSKLSTTRLKYVVQVKICDTQMATNSALNWWQYSILFHQHGKDKANQAHQQLDKNAIQKCF